MTFLWTCRNCGSAIHFSWAGGDSPHAPALWKTRRTCDGNCPEASKPVRIGFLARTPIHEEATVGG